MLFFFLYAQFCSAINNLEKFRTELERVAARMLAIMRENAPEKLTEYAYLPHSVACTHIAIDFIRTLMREKEAINTRVRSFFDCLLYFYFLTYHFSYIYDFSSVVQSCAAGCRLCGGKHQRLVQRRDGRAGTRCRRRIEACAR